MSIIIRRGGGHLYQGRFKSFPVSSDEHFLTLCRYVEANARRARLGQASQSSGSGADCGIASGNLLRSAAR